jgi:hypothetical protein
LAIKVTGPKTPGAGPEAEGAQEIGKAGKPGAAGKEPAGQAGRTFAETLAAGRTAPTAGAEAARGPDALTADIAADLKAGKVDAKGALDRVVERVLDQQLGADAPAALREQLRRALQDTVGSDPMLAERIRSLG